MYIVHIKLPFFREKRKERDRLNRECLIQFDDLQKLAEKKEHGSNKKPINC
jgi:hypothetical protein